MKKIATLLVLAMAVVVFQGCCARPCPAPCGPSIGCPPPPPPMMKQLEK